MRELEGKVALITGASSGIGAAVASCFAREGAAVALLARNTDRLAQTAASIISSGATAATFCADVTDAAAVAATVDATKARFGTIDILVNCAGIFSATPAGQANLAEANRMMAVNIGGVLIATEAVVPTMKQAGSGTIINIGSVAGVMTVAGYAVYCATKAAVLMLTRAHARELAPYGIRVNAVAPGNTATPMNEAMRSEPQFLEQITRATPSGRAYSSPADISEAVLFLASLRAAACHGAVLMADEGISLGF